MPIHIAVCVRFPWRRDVSTVTQQCSGTLLRLLSNATIQTEGLSEKLLRTRQWTRRRFYGHGIVFFDLLLI
jgi:hypothetical protein